MGTGHWNMSMNDMNNELERFEIAGGIRKRQGVKLGKEVGTGHWSSCKSVHACTVLACVRGKCVTKP